MNSTRIASRLSTGEPSCQPKSRIDNAGAGSVRAFLEVIGWGVMNMKRYLWSAAVIAAAGAMTACSEAPKPAAESKVETEAKKEPAGPPQPVTAKTAYWEMYKPARAWATDLLPLSVANIDV